MTLPTRLTSVFAAFALAMGLFATTAAPARASDDAAKLLFGAAALAIIAGAVHAERDGRRHYDPRPKRTHRATVLPHRCQITVRANGHLRNAYQGRCLHRAGLRGLPQRCVVGEWKGAVYGARCLRRSGYITG